MKFLSVSIGFWVVFVTLVMSPARAELFGQQLHFEAVTSNRLLQEAGLELLYADADSRLWGGTENGLVRLRKSAPISYDLPDGRALAVSAVFQSSTKELWIGYRSGDVARMKENSLIYWEPEEGHPASTITAFAEDQLGQIWIATYGEGLYCISTTGRVYHFGADDGPVHEEIYSIQLGPDGLIWAATDAGIIRCGYVEGEKIIKLFQDDITLPDEIVLSLSAEKEGMWIGTHQGGVAYYDYTDGALCIGVESEALGPVIALTRGVNEEVFALHRNGKLSRWRYSTGTCLGGVEEASPATQAITFDREGNLWLFDDQEKLHFAQLKFTYPQVSVHRIQSVLAIEEELLIGSEHGLYRGNPARKEDFKRLPKTEKLNIISLAKVEVAGAEPWILAGTFGDGLLICRAADCQLYTEEDGLSNNNVLSIAVTLDSIWLATLGGVTVIPINELRTGEPKFQKITKLGEQFIYQVIAVKDNEIWIATDGEGLISYASGVQKKYVQSVVNTDTFSLERIVSAVYFEPSNIGWVNSQKNGLFEIREAAFLPKTVKGVHFSGEENISALLVDAAENLLVVYPGGVDIGVNKGAYWVSFGHSAGFKKGGSALNAYSPGKDDVIWLIVGEQLVKYQSNYTFANQPFTQLTNITASGVPIGKTQADLAHDLNHLVFEYDGNWLSDPEEVRFRYRLLGQDLDWVYSTDNRATYSNLPPGKYTFELQSSLYGQFETSEIIAHHFRIWPAWWKSWWAILLYMFIAGFAFVYINKRQQLRRTKIAQLENDKIVNELTALKAQVNPHFLFNSFSTLIATIEQSQESGIAYTEQLAAFFRRVLGLSTAETIPVSDEIELVENYFFLLQKRFGAKLELVIDVKEQSGTLPPMCLQILVENAIKHNTVSNSQPLLIRIHRTEDYIEVSNPIQPKINKESSSGFGLSSIKRRYEILGVNGIQINQSENDFNVRLKIL